MRLIGALTASAEETRNVKPSMLQEEVTTETQADTDKLGVVL